MNALAQSWSKIPRALKWGVYALLVICLYFLVAEPALNYAGTFNTRADAIETSIRREKELASTDSGDGQLVAQGERFFGKPMFPTDPAARPETLYRVVDRILHQNGILEPSISERSVGTQFRSEQTSGLSDRPIERFSLEVAFETTPKTATKIIEELEEAPEVTAISRVRIEKYSSRAGSKDSEQTVRVTLAPEIWVLAGNASQSGGNP